MSPWFIAFVGIGLCLFGNVFMIESALGAFVNGIAGLLAIAAAEREWKRDGT